MIEAVAFAVAISSLGTAVAVGGTALVRRFRRHAFTPMLAVLQSGTVVLAAAETVAWTAGHRPGEPAVHTAYLVASLAVLPLAAFETRQDDGAWSSTLLLLALLVLAVLVVRMQATWR